ncbi:MAG: ATP-dependent RecD-like DNA helicase [Candidatus Binatia bacterium]
MNSKRNSIHGHFPARKDPLPCPGERSSLRGTVAKITYQNQQNRYTVARLEVDGFREITIVGEIFPISEGEEITVSGLWKMHRRYGLQFRAEQWERVEPATLQGIERYLGSGLIKGVGPAFARRLVSSFGLDTLRVLSEEPHRLLEVEGIGEIRTRRIIQAWEKQKGIQQVMVFLQGLGVSSALALKIYRVFGPETITKIKENPYCLAYEVYGIGFLLADRIAGELGIKGDSPLRVQAGVLHVLGKSSEEGHCFVPLALLKSNLSYLLGVEGESIDSAVEDLTVAGKVITEKADGEAFPRVYRHMLYEAECNVARALRHLLSSPSSFCSPGEPKVLDQIQAPMDLLLEETQREAVLQAMQHKVLVITGGPGTGKTTLLAHLLALFRNSNVTFALGAPTGRAAKKMGEMAGEEAKTIHRLLEYSPRDRGFQRGEKDPLGVDVVIIDEASMVDLPLMDHLLRAVKPHSHLILIGDVDQLPSVGPGNVLRDLIESGVVPVIVLRQIFRQGRESLIVVNAHRILQGEPPLFGNESERPDFVYIARESQEEILEAVKELAKERISREPHLEPTQSVQVLCPTNRGLLGTVHLNQELQNLLNPDGESVERGERLFRVGDRVMQLRNNYEKGVFNGDLGRIEQVDMEEEKLRVHFDGSSIAYDFDELDELSLAYATSIHKSQGSEYPGVVIPLHTSHYPMLHRSILYTAVTRGKELVVLIGSKKAVWMAIKNLRVEQRFTALKERLRES